jgi:hypothetical protein
MRKVAQDVTVSPRLPDEVYVAENVWAVNGTIQQTGTEATPFSAAV